MNLMYTDETNVDPKRTDFFVYAGVVIPSTTAGNLSASIDSLRKRYGYRPGDYPKFNTAKGLNYIAPDIHKLIKQEIITECCRSGLKLIASLVSHRSYKNSEEARLYGIDQIVLHFDYYLNAINDYGLVLIDRFQNNSQAKKQRGLLTSGVSHPSHPQWGRYELKRILGIHSASMGTSNFCSVIDIVLGSLGFAVRNRNQSEKLPMVQTLLRQIAPLAIRNLDGKVAEFSIWFPRLKTAPTIYREEYVQLHKFLAENGLDCEQIP